MLVKSATPARAYRRVAEVRLRRQNLVADVVERPARVQVLELVPAREEAVEAPEEVVAGHDPDPPLTRESALARDLSDGIGAGLGIHAARVRRDLDAPLDDRGQDAFHLRDEIGRVATLRITRFLFLEDGHRHFGQIVHHQVVDRAAGHLAVRCLQPISPKALPTRDTNRRRSCAHWPLPPVAPRAAAVSVARRAATLPLAPATRAPT